MRLRWYSSRSSLDMLENFGGPLAAFPLQPQLHFLGSAAQAVFPGVAFASAATGFSVACPFGETPGMLIVVLLPP